MQRQLQQSPRIGHKYIAGAQKLSLRNPMCALKNLNSVSQMNTINKAVPMTPNYQNIHPTFIRTSAVSNPTSPLSLNIGSPMYSSLPGSPNCSPAMSPVQRERILSPYPKSLTPGHINHMQYSPVSSRMVSPTGLLQAGDPYLPNQMQASPNFVACHQQSVNDVEMMIPSTDFWMDQDIFQDSNNLLTGLDDIKLV